MVTSRTRQRPVLPIPTAGAAGGGEPDSLEGVPSVPGTGKHCLAPAAAMRQQLSPYPPLF